MVEKGENDVEKKEMKAEIGSQLYSFSNIIRTSHTDGKTHGMVIECVYLYKF